MNFVKNHWKKLTFATVCLGYGANYGCEQYETSRYMRQICEQVLAHTEQNVGRPKRVLVVMNPVAKGKKTEKMFQKYCEPLLHLAGYSVDIVKTNFVGHAKQVVEQLKEIPDAIVVAGGDGTSSEVVTGLLRRDQDDINCPLVFLPLGNRNETAYKFLQKVPQNTVEYNKSLPTALLPMIYERVQPKSVIKFDVLDSTVKPTYGLTHFSWGLLREIESIKDKYWYFGPLRHNAAAFFNAFNTKKLDWHFDTDVEYTPPCAGCSNCVQLKKSRRPKPLFMKFMREEVTPEYLAAQRINEQCNVKTQDHLQFNQLNIICDGDNELKTICIDSLHPGLDFLKNVPQITRNNIAPAFEIRSRTIKLTPKTEQLVNQYFTIDGEEYDIRPICLSIIPNALKVYC